jgi:DNA-binding response OmpR family regulator
MARILVVEDDHTLGKILVSDLELEGFLVTLAVDGFDALDKAKSVKPDLILLDIQIPKMNGYDVCRSIRKGGSDVPIIMVTSKGQEAEKVVGLDHGADDYVTKPYSSMELLARVRALLRRHKRVLDKVEVTQFGDVVLDFKRQEATKMGTPLSLTTKEFQILELLVRHRGEVVSRDLFLEEVWGYDEKPSTRTVDNRIMQLRHKISPENPEAYIVSVHGSGYKFIG